MAKKRLDILVVERGLAESRARAQAIIMAGEVRVDDRVVDKAGTMVADDATVEVAGARLPYVSRGGLKLEAALDIFGVNPDGKAIADVGASTGGFTDCLLQRGAARVYAIDVGYGQLAWRLRQDPRVVVMERTNVRYLEALPEPIDLVTIDVSFISLELVLPVVARWLQERGEIVALVKPQFEVGKGEVGRGGVVRRPEQHREVLARVAGWARGLGLCFAGVAPSPVLGPAGNREFLAHLVPGAPRPPGDEAAMIERAVEQAW
ncbi:MAG TPA: TlyA family RNA methyltransferase [Anaerolineae bacterium]|nr:TlyA family RNA methyltransferase [Anaerolineae bacterium]HPL29528.1 TlyA family RNA methyltransferase [Anaerolineae bacterium]